MKQMTAIEKITALDTISNIVLNEFGILRRLVSKEYNVKLDTVQITLENYCIYLQMSDKYLSVEGFDICALSSNNILLQLKNVSLIDLMTNVDIYDVFASHDCHACYF